MFKNSDAFSGFSVDDIAKAKQFYTDMLGLETKPVAGMEEIGMLELYTKGNHPILIYAKPDHQPATFTILNFPVASIEQAIDELAAKGVTFEDIPGMDQDAKLIMRGKQMNMGPDVAWFKDPAGNSIAIMED